MCPEYNRLVRNLTRVDLFDVIVARACFGSLLTRRLNILLLDASPGTRDGSPPPPGGGRLVAIRKIFREIYCCTPAERDRIYYVSDISGMSFDLRMSFALVIDCSAP